MYGYSSFPDALPNWREYLPPAFQAVVRGLDIKIGRTQPGSAERASLKAELTLLKAAAAPIMQRAERALKENV
jgi:hypothetical protein